MSTQAERLGGLSLAEHEYAWRFRDHLEIGGPRPDATGFDSTRIQVIERALSNRFFMQRERLRRRR